MESLEYIIGSSSSGSGRGEYFIYVIYLCYIKFLFVEGNLFPGNQNKKYIYLAKKCFLKVFLLYFLTWNNTFPESYQDDAPLFCTFILHVFSLY